MREAILSGWNASRPSSFSPTPTNLIGFPVMLFTESAAPPRVSESNFVRMTPVRRHLRVELLRDIHGVLPRHGVRDQEHLVGLRRVADAHQLGHQRVVRLQASRRIDDDRVELLAPRAGKRPLDDAHGVLHRFPVHLDAGLLAQNDKLLHGGRPHQVRRHQQRLPSLLLQPQRELGGRGGLARALEPRKQDHRLRVRPLQGQTLVLSAQESHHPVVEDLDELLARRHRAENLLPRASSVAWFTNLRTTRRFTSASRRAILISLIASWMFFSEICALPPICRMRSPSLLLSLSSMRVRSL